MNDAAVVDRGAAGSRRNLLPYLLLGFISAMGYGLLFTLLAELRERFGLSESQVGAIASVGFLAGFVAQVGLSRLADRGHGARMIRLGLCAMVLSMLLLAIAETFVAFLVARIVLGLASGVIVPAARRYVILVDPDKRGENLGRLGAWDVAGFLASPVFAGVLVEWVAWEAPFVALGLLAIVMLGVTRDLAPDNGPVDSERRSVRALLRQPEMLAALSVAAAFFTLIGTFDALWAVMLSDLGASTIVIGFTIALAGIPLVLLAPFGGRTAQRVGPAKTAMTGLLVSIPCTVLYGYIGSIALITVVVLAHATSDAFVFPASQLAAAEAAPDEQAAAAQGLVSAAQLLVGGLVALVVGSVYETGGAERAYPLAAIVACGFLGLAALFHGSARNHATRTTPNVGGDALTP